MKNAVALLAAGMLLFPSLTVAAQMLPAACGPYQAAPRVKTEKSHHPPIQAAPGMATLVFVNTQESCTGCDTVNAAVDGKWVGTNKNNSYFTVTVAPGKRHLCTYGGMGYLRYGMADEPRYMVRLTELDAEAGQTYYFATDVRYNPDKQMNALHVWAVAPDEGKFLVSQSRLAIAKAKKR